MTTERRLLLAIVLTFVVLTAYQWLVPTPQPARSSTGQPATPAAGATTAPGGAQPAPSAAAPASSQPAAPQVETLRADSAENSVVVDNGLVRAAFSNRGATLTSWLLTQYLADGKPVDLVPHDLPDNQPKPFSLKLEDPAKTARLNSALFVRAGSTAGEPDTLDARSNPVTLTFEYQDAGGLTARKEFVIEPNSYVVSVSATVTDGSRAINPAIQWGPGLGDVAASQGASFFVHVRSAEGIFSVERSVERTQAANLVQTPRYQGIYDFAGIDTHYFMSAAIKPGAAELEYQTLSLPSPSANPPVSRDYVGYDIRLRSAGSTATAKFFVGPKHFESLRRVDTDLVRAIWFGMFAFLCVPLLSALNWLHGFVGNYGWAIILLTIIINAAMFPLRHKSNVSMRKMQAIQPQVKGIQDRYAKLKVTDPARQKMNTELMELYKQKGVNPASGCVPMLLTFPVLLAFYSLLSEAIELRGAPFIWWIKDLAAADPYYVFPILMGASQVLQQRMMPTTGIDPVQQKMMLFMPIIFTFLFLTSPAGLAIYWFASNVLVILQQVLTNRLIGTADANSRRQVNA
jgi:YidC/Oxa1 family membrane protein insertase